VGVAVAKTLTPGQLYAELSRLSREVPHTVELVLHDVGLELQGRLVQEEIAATTPYQPVDQSQYKGSWRGTPLRDGYLVYNLAKHALWVERGQRPGAPVGVLYRVLQPWAKRHGMPKSAAWAIANKIHQQGTEPTWVLKRATERALPILKRRMRAALKKHLAKG
jgi:hypothetical protein